MFALDNEKEKQAGMKNAGKIPTDFVVKANIARIKGTLKWLTFRSNPLLLLLSKPPEERDKARIERSRPAFRKLSPLFEYMDNNMVDHVLKYVKVEHYARDELIVKEEEIGTKFYLIMSGKVSVYLGQHANKLRLPDRRANVPPAVQERRTSVAVGQETRPGIAGGQDRRPSVAIGQERRSSVVAGQERRTSVTIGQERRTSVVIGQERRTSVAIGQERLTSVKQVDDRRLNLDDIQEKVSCFTPLRETRTIDELSLSEAEAILAKTRKRDILGKYYSTLNAGAHFGEVALLSADGIRNASVVADEDTCIVAFPKQLYGQTVKMQQEYEFKLRTQFVTTHPFFSHWHDKLKHQLQAALDHRKFRIGDDIILQCNPAKQLTFIIRGEARVITEPGRLRKQMTSRTTLVATAGSGEGIKVADSSADIGHSHVTTAPRRPNLDSVPLPFISDMVALRRIDGYVAAEKVSFNRVIDLCFVAGGEVLGDVEYLTGMETYLTTVKCTAECEVYSVNYQTIDRLTNKRNAQTFEQMRHSAEMKLSIRMASEPGKKVHSLPELVQRLQDMKVDIKSPAEALQGNKPRKASTAFKRISDCKSSQRLPTLNKQLRQITKLFVENKFPLLVPYTNGAVYYRRLSLKRAEIRAEQRHVQPDDVHDDFPSLQRQLSDAKLENHKEVKLYQKKRQRLMSKGNIESIDINKWKL